MPRFGAKRPQKIRETLPIILIVCDDSKTAPAYFEELRSLFKQHCTLKITPLPKEGAAVIKAAFRQKRRISDKGKGATAWALVDLEMKTDSASLTISLRNQAKAHGVELLLSQPCFEVWVLAHLIKTGQHFGSCDAVLQEVRKHWKEAFGQDFSQKKAQADYSKLMDKLSVAVATAKSHKSTGNQSWTEVWRVLEHALSFYNP